MAYFNHAFQQTFAPTSFLLSGGEDSSVLTPLEAAFINAQTYDVANTATVQAGATNLILAMGSPLGSATGVVGAVNDILGGNRFHGGYAESWKSKMINPNYVRFIGKQEKITAVQAKLVLEAKGECFPCAEAAPSYRVDFKGEPALRALNRNAYKVLGGSGHCCATGETWTDPALVMAEYGIQLLKDPIISQLIDVKVTGTVAGVVTTIADSTTGTGSRYEKQKAAIVLLEAYTPATSIVLAHEGHLEIYDTSDETVFGNCSFDTRDHYQQEPLQIFGEELDEDGDPCTNNCITSTKTDGIESGTKGELVLRDVLMYQRYMQHPTNQGNRDSARFREIEKTGPADGGLGITRGNDYTMYYLLHTVPRFNNPTGTFDNDQYLIKIATDGVIANLETQLAALSTGAGLGGTVTDMNTAFLPGYTGN